MASQSNRCRHDPTRMRILSSRLTFVPEHRDFPGRKGRADSIQLGPNKFARVVRTRFLCEKSARDMKSTREKVRKNFPHMTWRR